MKGGVGIVRLSPTPKELPPVHTTVWSFPRRGRWATHRGDYRGNWAPQIPRALISMYTSPGELVLDPMCGSGTTCIEARLLGRNCICLDISEEAVKLASSRLEELERAAELGGEEARGVLSSWSRAELGDARKLSLESSSVDLVAAHPPYWRIIKYGRQCKEGDLSCARSLEEYVSMVREVAREIYRVLRPGKHAALLVGDTRVRKHYVPLSYHVLKAFLSEGFLLREEVIKVQHNMRATKAFWERARRDFLLIYHEKLFVFRKPAGEGERRRLALSAKL
ncbi:MAG: DNA methyltransferase [Acidilobaceae archaeon]|nr:DNA methyltransferase [Acidilobaceae archaeon]